MTPRQRVVFFLAGGLCIGLVARLFMGHPLTMATRAMVPSVWPGDVVWVSDQGAVAGDVVQVRLSEEIGLYRVVAEGGTVPRVSACSKWCTLTDICETQAHTANVTQSVR